MAKSFHTIINEKVIEVSHKGNDVTLDLPEWLCVAGPVLEDESELKQWAEEHEILHGLLHAGIQQVIIQMRAKARPDEDTSILKDKSGAQKRLNEFVVKPIAKPGQSKAKAVERELFEASKRTAIAMQAAGVATGTIKTVLEQNLSPVQVAQLLNDIAVD